jgi:hypothetical protein
MLSLLGTAGLGIAGWSTGHKMCEAAGYPAAGGSAWSPCFWGGAEGVVGMLVGMSLGAGAGAWAGSQVAGGRPHILGSLAGGLGGTLLSALIVGLGSAVIAPDVGDGMVVPMVLLALLAPPVGATWATEYSHQRMLETRGSAVLYGVTFAPRPRGGLVSFVGAF